MDPTSVIKKLVFITVLLCLLEFTSGTPVENDMNVNITDFINTTFKSKIKKCNDEFKVNFNGTDYEKYKKELGCLYDCVFLKLYLIKGNQIDMEFLEASKKALQPLIVTPFQKKMMDTLVNCSKIANTKVHPNEHHLDCKLTEGLVECIAPPTVKGIDSN